jgi:hypothetical protein
MGEDFKKRRDAQILAVGIGNAVKTALDKGEGFDIVNLPRLEKVFNNLIKAMQGNEIEPAYKEELSQIYRTLSQNIDSTEYSQFRGRTKELADQVDAPEPDDDDQD